MLMITNSGEIIKSVRENVLLLGNSNILSLSFEKLISVLAFLIPVFLFHYKNKLHWSIGLKETY